MKVNEGLRHCPMYNKMNGPERIPVSCGNLRGERPAKKIIKSDKRGDYYTNEMTKCLNKKFCSSNRINAKMSM